MTLNNTVDVDGQLLELVWNNTNDAIFTIGYDGHILDANPAFISILGWDKKDLEYQHASPIFTECSYLDAQKTLEKLRLGQDITYHVTERKRKDGQILNILASYKAVHSKDILAVGMYKDFTEQMRIQQKLQANKECYQNLVEFIPDALFVEQNGLILFLNTPGIHMLGGSNKANFVKKNLWQLLKSTDQQSLQEKVYRAKEAGVPIVEKVQREDGHTFWAEISVMPTIFNERYVNQWLVRDITLKKNYQDQLEYMAFHDPLTGLVNRRFFIDHVDHVINSVADDHTQFAILYLDMDKFKSINDEFGHDVGDELLKQFADKLRYSLRKEDVICRIGGDEFLVFLSDINSKEEIERIIDRLIVKLKESYPINHHEFSVTTSIGVSIFPKDGDNVKTLMRKADQALYTAKEKRDSYALYDRL
ncbi:diguanylate cyclase domain-containing protein [Lysinibacillus irui]|uniref:diguanylate cyclase domain-containing protein n=1 Tax=Lysinibacillus irui TaxID=2998077 RepID=UPI004044A33C